MTTDEKLDYLIEKIESLESEIKKIKLDNEKSNYELHAKFYDAFKVLHDNIYRLDAERYKHYRTLNDTIHEIHNKNYSLEKHIEKIEEHKPLNIFFEKFLPLSPVILIALLAWVVVIFIILS